jgi:hypothetical protein
MYLDVIFALAEKWPLQNLRGLALSGGGWHCRPHGYFWTDCDWHINGINLTKGLKSLLPLPHLQDLRLSAGPYFLYNLDLQKYREIAAAFPSLKRLRLGHPVYKDYTTVWMTWMSETVPLQNVAAFCSMLPRLLKVDIGGGVDIDRLPESPQLEWRSPSVISLTFHCWTKIDIVECPPEIRRVWFPNVKEQSIYCAYQNRTCRICGDDGHRIKA